MLLDLDRLGHDFDVSARFVECDFCGEDYTDRPVSGGVLIGRKAACPSCAPALVASGKHVAWLCPKGRTFAEWVLDLRAWRRWGRQRRREKDPERTERRRMRQLQRRAARRRKRRYQLRSWLTDPKQKNAKKRIDISRHSYWLTTERGSGLAITSIGRIIGGALIFLRFHGRQIWETGGHYELLS